MAKPNGHNLAGRACLIPPSSSLSIRELLLSLDQRARAPLSIASWLEATRGIAFNIRKDDLYHTLSHSYQSNVDLDESNYIRLEVRKHGCFATEASHRKWFEVPPLSTTENTTHQTIDCLATPNSLMIHVTSSIEEYRKSDESDISVGFCAKCSGILCSGCAGKRALIPYDASEPDESNDLDKNSTVKVYCKGCFEETSVLDYSKNDEEYLPPANIEASPITFLMVHGGGGTRAMFRPHAQCLAKRGYRSILLDLPGHGTMVDEPLSLDSCVETVRSVMSRCRLDSTMVIYVGASFGAYVGFYIMDKLCGDFCGATMMDCGQNVGPGASIKASVGMWFLNAIAENMSNKSLLSAMLSTAQSSPADYKLVESVLGTGMFFDQGARQVTCLGSVAPAEHIPNFEFPMLFMNGSDDHRDSEEKWLSLCNDQERSLLKVFQGGDHFFCHDSRFVNEIIDLMDNFAKSVTG